MAKAPAGSSFQRYERQAPSAQMRELAHVAALRQFSQEQLAERYAEHTGVVASGANVMRHFMSERPTQETIDAYAAVLKVTREHLELAAGGALSPGRTKAVIGEIEADLQRSLKAEAAAAARKAFELLPSVAQQRAVSEYALESHRSHFASGVGRYGLRALSALAKRIPGLDVDAARLVHDPRESFLVTVLVAARGVLDESRTDALLTVARSLARDQGLDTAQMESRLAKVQQSKGGRFYKAADRGTDKRSSQ